MLGRPGALTCPRSPKGPRGGPPLTPGMPMGWLPPRRVGPPSASTLPCSATRPPCGEGRLEGCWCPYTTCRRQFTKTLQEQVLCETAQTLKGPRRHGCVCTEPLWHRQSCGHFNHYGQLMQRHRLADHAQQDHGKVNGLLHCCGKSNSPVLLKLGAMHHQEVQRVAM